MLKHKQRITTADQNELRHHQESISNQRKNKRTTKFDWFSSTSERSKGWRESSRLILERSKAKSLILDNDRHPLDNCSKICGGGITCFSCPFNLRILALYILVTDILIPFATQLKLDEDQVREQENLRVKLQQEQELLSAYQSKQTMQLRAQHEREEKDLQEKVSVRRALLEEKVSRLLMRCVFMKSIHPTNLPYQLIMKVYCDRDRRLSLL